MKGQACMRLSVGAMWLAAGRAFIALVRRTGDDRVLRTSRALEPLLKPALRKSGAIAGQISGLKHETMRRRNGKS